MKRTKRIFAIFMTLALAMSMLIVSSAASFAADPTYTLAVKNDTEGYTYQAYQIFTGSLSDGTLSNVAWGAGISDAGKTALYTKYNLTGTNQTAAKVAEAIAADTDTDKADAIATLLAKTTTGALGTAVNMPYSENVTVGTETFKGYAAAGQAAGWYLVVNTAVPAGNETYSDYIVQVVDNVAIAPKSDKPSSEKHVNDINDSTGAASTLKDSADHEIGDLITYTLTATLPSDYAKYDKYYIQFQDDMSKGLTYKAGSAEIKYGNADAVALADPTAAAGSSYTDGQLWTWTIADLKTTAPSLGAGDVITITYEAYLNENAVVGEAGNPNKYRIEFSNNQNNTGEGAPHGTTPWDVNIVFTYKTVFNKVDSSNKPLTGADFKLEKFIKSENGTETYKNVKGTWVDVTTLGTEKHPSKTVENLTNDNGTAENAKFTFSGIDDGYYRLTETETPAGYNTIDPVEFEITATHDLVSDDPKLTALAGTGGAEFTMSLTDGSLTSDVINNKGAELPETGGIGTIIFYVLGSLLVVGCGIVLISKRRMESR